MGTQIGCITENREKWARNEPNSVLAVPDSGQDARWDNKRHVRKVAEYRKWGWWAVSNSLRAISPTPAFSRRCWSTFLMQRKELLNELFESKGIRRTDANMSTYERRNMGPLGETYSCISWKHNLVHTCSKPGPELTAKKLGSRYTAAMGKLINLHHTRKLVQVVFTWSPIGGVLVHYLWLRISCL